MNYRVTRLLLALYPRAWRDRYGAEVASLTDELIRAGETTPLPAGLNLVAGAMMERARELAGSRSALAVTSAAVIIAMIGGAFVVTGSPRPGQGLPGVASASCPVAEPFQVKVSAVGGTRLPVVAPPQFGDPAGLGRRRPAVPVAVRARPQVLVVRPDRVGRIRPAAPELTRTAEPGRARPAELIWEWPVARSCQRPLAGQDPVSGPARMLRVRPPVPVATRVTR